MRHFNILIILVLTTLFSCSNSEHKISQNKDNNRNANTTKQRKSQVEVDKELERTWAMFSSAVLAHNLKTIKELSMNCVYLDFTTHKGSPMDEWVSIDKFLKKKIAIVFDSTTKSRILDRSKVSFSDGFSNEGLLDKKCIAQNIDIKSSRLQVVLVTIIDSFGDQEGTQLLFDFILTKQGYKFCGVGMIP